MHTMPCELSQRAGKLHRVATARQYAVLLIEEKGWWKREKKNCQRLYLRGCTVLTHAVAVGQYAGMPQSLHGLVRVVVPLHREVLTLREGERRRWENNWRGGEIDTY